MQFDQKRRDFITLLGGVAAWSILLKSPDVAVAIAKRHCPCAVL
jgi:hypothetical protein